MSCQLSYAHVEYVNFHIYFPPIKKAPCVKKKVPYINGDGIHCDITWK
jgi:hypothetical protein